MKDYYRILKVTPSASDDDVKRSYRTLAKQYHPDTNQGDDTAAARFAEINEAYDVLGDGVKRAEYDKRRANDRAAKTAQNSQSGAQNAQAYANARFQAQVQAAVNANLAAVRDRAFAAGRERGMSEYKATADKAAAKLNAEIRELGAAKKRLESELAASERNRRDIEQELFDRDRSVAEYAAKTAELEHKYASLAGAVEALGKAGLLDDKRVSQALDAAQMIALKSGGSVYAETAAADDGQEAFDGEITHSKRLGRIVLENVDLLKTAAVDGNADAQNELGKMYYYGIKVKRDLKQAVYWFKEAVRSKHFGAMYNLGVCFVNGEGTTKNESVGQGYIRQAEQLGNVEAKRSGKKYKIV